MISRSALLVCAAALVAGGCCCPDMGGNGCGPCGGGGGRGSLCCRTYEERMSQTDPCGTCVTPVGCGNGGVRGWLRNQSTCCKGCGDVYWGEWISDPPDCCDPCDSCGGFSGSGGTCCKPDILGRLRRAFNGYRYCPGECGGGCGIGSLSCQLCGDAGCNACGGGGGIVGRGYRGGMGEPRLLDENWDPPPSPKPTPGKPIHKANTPHSIKVGSGRMPGGNAVRQASYEPWR